MITIYSEKKEVRNNAMPSQMKGSVESVMPVSLVKMRELVKKNLDAVKVEWQNGKQK